MTSTKVALITGASAGLGRDLAKLFAQDGYELVLVARREDRLNALAEELRAAHGTVSHVLADDLSDASAPARIVKKVEQLGLEIDALVNNAGFGDTGPFVDSDGDRQLEMIQVNITSLVSLTHALVPGMVARGRGQILNLGSTAGFQPGPYMAMYYATKAFVNHFTEALGHELQGTGVTATVSCPGPTATEFGDVSGNAKTMLFLKGGLMASDSVARQAYRAMQDGKSMIVHGLKNRLAASTVRFTPRGLTRTIVATLNRPANRS